MVVVYWATCSECDWESADYFTEHQAIEVADNHNHWEHDVLRNQ